MSKKRKRRPAPHVINAHGRLIPHPFEEARDDPAPAIVCWFCFHSRDHDVHLKARSYGERKP